MRHFGIICPLASGHLFAMMALARELQNRGHKTTFYQLIDGEEKLLAQKFQFRAVGQERFPRGRAPAEMKRLGQLSGSEILQGSIELAAETAQVFLEEVPALARRDGINAFIVDEVSREGGTIAEELVVPFVTVSNSLIVLQERNVPPFFTPWKPGFGGWIKYSMANRSFDRMRRPLLRVLNARRAKLGFPVIAHPNQMSSKLLHLAQTPEDFEFPRREKPAYLHFVGPLSDPSVRGECDFPYERLDGRPLIYASLGTIAHRHMHIFQAIAEACATLPVQLILTLGGGGGDIAALGKLPGDPIVVANAPQLELLKRANLCVTHSGLNTVLECLANGVPMVAIPIGNDQPGVAARLAWKKAGEFIAFNRLNVTQLRKTIQTVLNDRKYAENAASLQKSIARAGGKRTAAHLIESSLT